MGRILFVSDCDATSGQFQAPFCATEVEERVRVIGATECGHASLQSVEARAQRLLNSVQAEVGDDPLCIVGVGVGGLVALEAVIRRLGQDRPVGWVGLIDTPASHPTYDPWVNGSFKLISIDTQQAPLDWSTRQPNAWKRLAPPGAIEFMQAASPQAAVEKLLARGHAAIPAHVNLGPNPIQIIQSNPRSKATIVCLPGAGDSVVRFVPFASALAPEFAVHGPQPRGIDGIGIPHSSVEAAAMAYARHLQAEAPQGALHLLGHSFGGWVAVELADILLRRGVRVDSLTLVDSDMPSKDPSAETDLLPPAVLETFLEILEMGAPGRVSFDRIRLHQAASPERLGLIQQTMIQASLLPARSRAGLLAGPYRLFSAALRATWRPKRKLNLPTFIAHVLDPAGESGVEEMRLSAIRDGWLPFFSDPKFWTATGNHMTAFSEPHAHELAQTWRSYISSVRQRVESGTRVAA